MDFEYRMTNKGLSINMMVLDHGGYEHLGVLNCCMPGTSAQVAVVLAQDEDGSFTRTRLHKLIAF